MASVKHAGGNVMVWGCFGGGKVGDLYRTKGIRIRKAIIPFCNAIPYGWLLIGAVLGVIVLL